MAKRMRSWNQTKYEQYLKSGRGQGEGSEYLPWIRIQDFSSLGTVSRVCGNKTKRVHHFLSKNELRYFYLLEWSNDVLDIREQYPLEDMELAIGIATEAGIKYPKDNISGFPYILTCDFMIATKTGFKARTIKCASELKSKRVLEKLEIERRYWQEIGVDWKLVTEKEIPLQKSKNIEWLYASAFLPNHLNDVCLQGKVIEQILENKSITQVLADIDEQFDLPKGSGIYLFKHLIWKKKLNFEMDIDLQKFLFSLKPVAMEVPV